MQEQIFAIGGASLYPEGRSKNMPEAGTTHTGGDKESKRTPATNGETRTKESQAEEKRRVREEAKKQKEAERRVKEELRMKREEAEVSAERTKEAAERAATKLRETPRETPQEKAVKPQVPSKENPVIVESYPHLANSSYEQLTKTLKDQNVQLDVPSEQAWEKMNGVEKDRWLQKHWVENVVKLPEIRGGAARYTDTNTVTDPQVLYNRLSELDEREANIGTFAFEAEAGNAGREEILERLSSRDVEAHRSAEARAMGGMRLLESREQVIQDALTRLKAYQSLERGASTYNAQRLNEVRAELIGNLIETRAADEVIDELFSLRSGTAPLSIGDSDSQRALQGALDAMIGYARQLGTNRGEGFLFVNNLANAVEKHQTLAESGGLLASLDAFLPQALRSEVLAIRSEFDRHFLDLTRNLGTQATSQLFREFDSKAKVFESQLQWGSLDSPEDLENRLYMEARRRGVHARGREGIFEWRAAQIYEGYQRTVVKENELGIPRDWRDSLRNANNNFRYVESTDAPLTQLQESIGRVVQISEALTQVKGQHAVEAQALKEKIDRIKNAVEAKYIFRKEMVNSSMDPEKVVNVFTAEQWSDTTHRDMYARFDEDHNERLVGLTNPDTGQVIVADFNLLDKAMQVYFRRMTQERRVMNDLEALTIVDISTSLDPARYDQIRRLQGKAALTHADELRIESLRQEMVRRMLDKGYSLTQWAGSKKEIDTIHMRQVITEWYTDNLLLGAHGIVEVEEQDPVNPALKRKVKKEMLDVRRDELREQLEANLRSFSPNQEWQDRVSEYKEAGLLSQVTNVAYWENWMNGAFSDYDGIRILDKNQKWFESKERGQVYKQGGYVFNRYTSLFFGRHIDHMGEFLQDEFRGRPGDVNLVFRENMLGKRRGLLGHNRLLVKVIADNIDSFLGNNQSDKAIRDRLVVDGSGRSFREVLYEKIENLENIEKLSVGKRVSKDGDYTMEGGVVYDRGWARGAAIEELLDDGIISFENIEWSKIYQNETMNVIEYNMTDWWSDRAESKKYFSTQALQEYLKNPGTKFFFKMNREIFYSKREIRIQPWMKLVIPAHQELGKHWQEWWKLPYDMPHAETKNVIDSAVRLNMLDYKYRDELEDKLLGWGPFSGSFLFGRVKALRYVLELVDRNSREAFKRDWEFAFLWPVEFFKVAGQQALAQVAGK